MYDNFWLSSRGLPEIVFYGFCVGQLGFWLGVIHLALAWAYLGPAFRFLTDLATLYVVAGSLLAGSTFTVFVISDTLLQDARSYSVFVTSAR